jgi:hypothetical protein
MPTGIVSTSKNLEKNKEKSLGIIWNICMDKEIIIDKLPPPTLRQLFKEHEIKICGIKKKTANSEICKVWKSGTEFCLITKWSGGRRRYPSSAGLLIYYGTNKSTTLLFFCTLIIKVM